MATHVLRVWQVVEVNGTGADSVPHNLPFSQEAGGGDGGGAWHRARAAQRAHSVTPGLARAY